MLQVQINERKQLLGKATSTSAISYSIDILIYVPNVYVTYFASHKSI